MSARVYVITGVQGSREIARHLDRLRPDPPLFRDDPGERAAVEEAERGGAHLDGHGGDGDPGRQSRQWLFMPAIVALARNSHADERTVRDTVAQVPELLDHVDELLAGGTIGGDHPNAADFQILAGVRVLDEFEDIAPLLNRRPCNAAARALFPDWVGPIPRGLPGLS